MHYSTLELWLIMYVRCLKLLLLWIFFIIHNLLAISFFICWLFYSRKIWEKEVLIYKYWIKLGCWCFLLLMSHLIFFLLYLSRIKDTNETHHSLCDRFFSIPLLCKQGQSLEIVKLSNIFTHWQEKILSFKLQTSQSKPLID